MRAVAASTGNRWLAHRKDVHVAFEVPKDRGHGVDVVIEIEAARRHWDVARILPVGDVDLMVGQKSFHSATQQRGEVAGHWRHQQ
jgi:hypothetical protein